jgi:hypothetical protein
MIRVPGLEHRADSRLHPVIRVFDDLEQFLAIRPVPNFVEVSDHINGFDITLRNEILYCINQHAEQHNMTVTVLYHQIYDDVIKQIYKNLCFKYHPCRPTQFYTYFTNYKIHPEQNFQHFLCSFNGGGHVSRGLLTFALQRRGWFDTEVCSKNFQTSVDTVDGNIENLVGSQARFYRKFFIGPDSEIFAKTINGFNHVHPHAHDLNVVDLGPKITASFMQLVTETIGTSYCPFVTEKFLYPIVNRTLFLTYAQPGWHTHIERYFGFRKYDKIFDYRFDSIINPVERVIALLDMLSKFSNLGRDDWHDLHQMESDTVEFNYQHYFSGDYMKQLCLHPDYYDESV